MRLPIHCISILEVEEDAIAVERYIIPNNDLSLRVNDQTAHKMIDYIHCVQKDKTNDINTTSINRNYALVSSEFLEVNVTIQSLSNK